MGRGRKKLSEQIKNERLIARLEKRIEILKINKYVTENVEEVVEEKVTE